MVPFGGQFDFSFLPSVCSALLRRLLNGKDQSLHGSLMTGLKDGLRMTSRPCGWSSLRSATPPLPSVWRPTSKITSKEGLYGKAVRALDSAGIAAPGDPSALGDMIRRHPQSPLPQFNEAIPSPLVIQPSQVQSALQSFPRGSSPGFSQLRIQHLYDVICCCTAPSSQDCLSQLTRWLNHLLSGKVHPVLAPWLCGASLTALLKPNNGGHRPIAVGDSFRRLISRLCCSALHQRASDVLLSHNQLGVGAKGGLETAINSFYSFCH